MVYQSSDQSDGANDLSTEWLLEPVINWLLKEGRLVSSVDEFTRNLGDTLYKAGAPLSRIRLTMRTLHPLVAASTFALGIGQSNAYQFLRVGRELRDLPIIRTLFRCGRTQIVKIKKLST